MSLLPTCYAVSPDARFNYVENVSRDGDRVQISTNGLGSLEVEANPAGVPNPVATLTTSQLDNATLRLGSSRTTYQHLVLKDGAGGVNALATFNTDVVCSNDLDVLGLVNVTGDVETLGNINLVNGGIGKSITGYYSVPTAPLNCPDGADTVVPNPAGLTQGYYIVAVSTAPGGQNQQQVATLAYRTSGGLWAIGGCCSSVTGPGQRFALNVSVDRTTMILSNSTGVAQNGCTVYFSKILN